jgi:periplasmic protein TonB
MSIELGAKRKIYKREISPSVDRVLDAANDSQMTGRVPGLVLAYVRRTQPQGLRWQPQFSAKTFIGVVCLHLALLAGLLLLNSVQPAQPLSSEPAAMMVSLVNDPAPEPAAEIVEIIPTPKPVIKKTKPIKQVVQPTPIPESIPEPTLQAAEPEIMMPEPVMANAPAPVVAKQEAPIMKELPINQEVIEPPRFGAAYLHNPAPTYPAVSRRVGEEGRVMLRVLVSKNGDAEQVEIESGSGFSRLDRAASDAVKKWRFIPAKRNNQPISAYVIVPIQFTLNS